VIRRGFRIVLWLGVFMGLGAIVLRFLRTRAPDSMPEFGTPPAPSEPWPPLALPAEPVPMRLATWVDPEGKVCPTSHPVKAKLSSGIFHLPGGLNYERTNPERCYVDGAAAEADGLRQSKR
jgi:micrococcal nuclease